MFDSLDRMKKNLPQKETTDFLISKTDKGWVSLSLT